MPFLALSRVRKSISNMKKLISSLIAMLFALTISAQDKYFTRHATIIFDAEGKLDDIEEVKAKNSSATCIVEPNSGQMEWAVLMKAFSFKSALMQEHFNENYVESNRYPKAVFKGKILNPDAVKWTADGEYPVTVKGSMALHGKKKEMIAKGKVVVQAGHPSLSSHFNILLEDYAIKIPSLVGSKVAEEVKISVAASLEKLVK